MATDERVNFPDSPPLNTIGRENFPGYCLRLWHNAHETFTPLSGSQERLRIVLVEQGTGILTIATHQHTHRQPFIAPSLFCLNQHDSVTLEQNCELHAQSLYFFPGIINSAFDMNNIYSNTAEFSGTAYQDFELLNAFVQRTVDYHGQIPIDTISARRLSSLLRSASIEMALQRDCHWPCRSRSFLLETLFVISRLYDAPQESAFPLEMNLSHCSSDIDPVILHLHTHYHEKLTIEALARQFHTNRTTLEERFREATGTPIMTYLTRLRIRIATSILHDTQIPVFEVAERVGFKDTTHFGRTFRKYIGCSPIEYRQRYCWMLQ